MKNVLYHPLLQLIIQSSREVIILLDRHFKIVIFNSVAENIFNCTANKVIGTEFNALCPQLNIIDHIKSQKNIWHSSGIVSDSHVGFNYINLIWQVFDIKLDNHLFYLLKTSGISEKDKQDKIIRLETLLENMPCNVYWMDENCIMVGCNQNVLSMLNLTKGEYVGKTYEELSEICHWPEGLAQKLKGDDQRVLRHRSAYFWDRRSTHSSCKRYIFFTSSDQPGAH